MGSWAHTRRHKFPNGACGQVQYFLNRCSEYLSEIFEFGIIPLFKWEAIDPVKKYMLEKINEKRQTEEWKPWFDRLDRLEGSQRLHRVRSWAVRQPIFGYLFVVSFLFGSVYYYWYWTLHYQCVAIIVTIYCSRLLIWCPPLFFIYWPLLMLMYLFPFHYSYKVLYRCYRIIYLTCELIYWILFIGYVLFILLPLMIIIVTYRTLNYLFNLFMPIYIFGKNTMFNPKSKSSTFFVFQLWRHFSNENTRIRILQSSTILTEFDDTD